MRRSLRKLAVLSAFGLIATAAQAQSNDQPAPARDATTPFSGDWLAVGGGVAVIPTYVGSDDYHVIPGGMVAGSVSGHDFMLRGLELSVDILKNPSDGGRSLSLGPVIGTSLDRTRRIRGNRQVAALGKLDMPLELGAYAAVDIAKGLTNPYDTLTFSLTGTRDVANAHDSYTITPSLSFRTPLSYHMLAGVTVSGEIVGDRFADYYYSVTPAGSTASGLRRYTAKGGLMDINASMFTSYTYRDDFKGWSLFAVGNYTRLRGSIADSPIVRDIGDRNQWFGAIGIGYVFQ